MPIDIESFLGSGTYAVLDDLSVARVSACRIDRGLYVIRYVNSPDGVPAVGSITVTEGELDLISAPNRGIGILDAPGQAIVIVARTPGAFDIRVSGSGRDRGADATFSLDIIDSGASERPDADRTPSAGGVGAGPHATDRGSLPLAIVAHLSRRGDVRAEAGEWIAGPADILPIEGLSIATLRPDVTVAVRVQTTDTGGHWSRWHGAGEFAGSRQRAEAITAIALALRGDASPHFRLEAEVIHLGAAGRTAEGPELEFFGHEPIVGFRLKLKNATNEGASSLTASSGHPSDRLKVFRARKH